MVRISKNSLHWRVCGNSWGNFEARKLKFGIFVFSFCFEIYYVLCNFNLVIVKWGVLNKKGGLVFHQKVKDLKWVENFGKIEI